MPPIKSSILRCLRRRETEEDQGEYKKLYFFKLPEIQLTIEISLLVLEINK